jgi:hypothetical protein
MLLARNTSHADQILIPVKPEFLPTIIGLPLIHESMAEFTKLYRKNIGTSQAEVRVVCGGFGWHVFPETHQGQHLVKARI